MKLFALVVTRKKFLLAACKFPKFFRFFWQLTQKSECENERGCRPGHGQGHERKHGHEHGNGSGHGYGYDNGHNIDMDMNTDMNTDIDMDIVNT